VAQYDYGYDGIFTDKFSIKKLITLQTTGPKSNKQDFQVVTVE